MKSRPGVVTARFGLTQSEIDQAVAWFVAGTNDCWRDVAERLEIPEKAKGGVKQLFLELEEQSVQDRDRCAETEIADDRVVNEPERTLSHNEETGNVTADREPVSTDRPQGKFPLDDAWGQTWDDEEEEHTNWPLLIVMGLIVALIVLITVLSLSGVILSEDGR
ncbi:hypothetical protein OAO01_06670 [Oligoflexia bacterium]|nr:hypothetical protein [Oligoflexia bacterium]